MSIAMVEGEVSNLEDLKAAVVNCNYKPFRSNDPNPRGQVSNPGSNPNAGQCFYCLKRGHYKRDCLTMKNDRGKRTHWDI